MIELSGIEVVCHVADLLTMCGEAAASWSCSAVVIGVGSAQDSRAKACGGHGGRASSFAGRRSLQGSGGPAAVVVAPGEVLRAELGMPVGRLADSIAGSPARWRRQPGNAVAGQQPSELVAEEGRAVVALDDQRRPCSWNSDRTTAMVVAAVSSKTGCQANCMPEARSRIARTRG